MDTETSKKRTRKKKAVPVKKGRRPLDPSTDWRMQAALRLRLDGYPVKKIAETLGVGPFAINNWLKKMGVPKVGEALKGVSNVSHEGLAITKEVMEKAKEDPTVQGHLEKNIPILSEEEMVAMANVAQLEQEHNALVEKAKAEEDAQLSYQAFAAQAGIKLMEQGLKQMTPPRSVAEMEKLDTLIRRNLGLHPTNGGGGEGGSKGAAGQIQVSVLIGRPMHGSSTPRTLDAGPSDSQLQLSNGDQKNPEGSEETTLDNEETDSDFE